MKFLYGNCKNAWYPCQPVATGTYSVTMQLSSQSIQKVALVCACNWNAVVLKTTLDISILSEISGSGFAREMHELGCCRTTVSQMFPPIVLSVLRLTCCLCCYGARKSLTGIISEVPQQQEVLPAFAIASVLPGVLRYLLLHICLMGPQFLVCM
jgi:hypothetical protein